MKTTKKAAEMTTREVASYIVYSVLKPEFTEQQIIDLTRDGVRLGCATICINPAYMDLCSPYVEGTGTMLCPVTDFLKLIDMGIDRMGVGYRSVPVVLDLK